MPTPINISASRGAAILGLSSWKTPIEVWLEIMESHNPGFCEKYSYTYPVFEETAAIRWGNAFESAIAELAESESQRSIINREKLFLAESANYITCHIDGEYEKQGIYGQYEDDLHEGKTTSIFYYRDNFGDPGTDKVPIEYQIQCQHQMICTVAEKVILSVLVFPRRVEEWEEMGWEIRKFSVPREYRITMNHENYTTTIIKPVDWGRTLKDMGYFHQYEINANPELQKLMIEYYTEFWNKNIIGGEMPRPQNYDDIKAIVKTPIGSIIADDKTTSMAHEYKDIKNEIGASGELQKRCGFIKTKVLDFMRNSETTLDDESKDKWILYDKQGKKLFQYNGKVFR